MLHYFSADPIARRTPCAAWGSSRSSGGLSINFISGPMCVQTGDVHPACCFVCPWCARPVDDYVVVSVSGREGCDPTGRVLSLKQTAGNIQVSHLGAVLTFSLTFRGPASLASDPVAVIDHRGPGLGPALVPLSLNLPDDFLHPGGGAGSSLEYQLVPEELVTRSRRFCCLGFDQQGSFPGASLRPFRPGHPGSGCRSTCR